MADQPDIMTSLSPVDAKAVVDISADKLTALITFGKPENNGAAVTLDLITQALSKKGVAFGVLKDRLSELVQNPQYDRRILIAEGIPPVNGDNAVITYRIRKEKDFRPKVKENGSVDFKDLDIIEHVSKGDVLCEKKPATPGEPGRNVLGGPIAQKQGRDFPLPQGKSTLLSEDKLQLIAAIDGQAEIVNKKINVLDTFTVEGDVSTATGNIQFVGNVQVNGGVQAGFTVQATGNIDIRGIVESAKVEAEGSVIIRGGFNGGEKGEIIAGENVTCRFVQGGVITAGGNLETTYILNAIVRCRGAVRLSGKGLIMGGRVTARTSVEAVALGSASSSADTIIEVGNDPKVARRYQDIPKELQASQKKLQSLQVLASTLFQLQQAGRLPPDNVDKLQKSMQGLKQLKTAIAELEDEYEAVKVTLAEAGSGTVKVSKTAFHGVKIIIGAEQLALQKDYEFTCFMRTDKGISAGPLR